VALASRWLKADVSLAQLDWEAITGAKSGRQLGIHHVLNAEFRRKRSVELSDEDLHTLQQLHDETKAFLAAQLLPIAQPYHLQTPLYLPQMDIVHFHPHDKEQMLHHDIHRGDTAQQRWSVLFYLHDTISTAVPMQPLSILKALWNPRLSEKEKKKLCNPNLWAGLPVSAGTILLMQQSTAHYGVPDITEERIVLFTIISPNADQNQTVWQRRYAKMQKPSKEIQSD